MKKSFSGALCTCFFALGLALYALPSFSLVLDIRNGVLHGAKEIQIDSLLYDVAFKDGTCIELYGGCDEQSDLPFDFLISPALAFAANLALIEQVFIDTPLGAFDSQPELTNGCFVTGGCQISTPLQLTSPNGIGLGWVFNRNSVNGDIATGSGGGLRDFDTDILNGFNDLHVYAVWSESSVTPPPPNPVSEPSILACQSACKTYQSSGENSVEKFPPQIV